MPAQSVQQAKLMRLVRGVQTGNVPSSKVDKKVKKMANDMSAADVKDFAETPDKGLPQTVKESTPEGWEKTVKGMKKHKDIDNPWALANWMKGKGYTPKKEQVSPKSGQTDLENNPALYKNSPDKQVTEAEDCGCGKTEQNIHTSNKLTLKAALNQLK
jgi:hypothetical protein